MRAAQPQAGTTCIAQRLDSESPSNQLSQASTNRCPRPEPIAPLVLPQAIEEFGASPALGIALEDGGRVEVGNDDDFDDFVIEAGGFAPALCPPPG